MIHKLICFFGWSLMVLHVLAQSPLSQTQYAIEAFLNEGRKAEAAQKLKQYLATERTYGKGEEKLRADDYYWLGTAQLRLGQFPEAEKTLNRALQLRAAAYGNGALVTGDVHYELGKLYLEMGSGIQAEDAFNKAHALFSDAMPVDTMRLFEAKEYLGGIYVMDGRLSDAEAMYDAVLTLQAALFGDHSVSLARVLNCLGGVYLAQGRDSRARGVYEQALNLQTSFYGPHCLESAVTCTNLGVLYDGLTEFEQAEKYLLRAYEIRGKHLRLTDPLLLASLDNLVNHYVKRAQFEKAYDLLESAKGIRIGKLGEDQPAVAEIMDRLATLAMAWDKGDMAERYWLKALQIRENSLGPQHELVSANLYNLGKLENALRKPEQARIHLNMALSNYEGNSKANESQVTAILSELFMSDYLQGNMEGAEEYLNMMRTIKTEVYGPAHAETLAVMEEQVKFYREVGQDWKAEQVEAELRKLPSGR